MVRILGRTREHNSNQQQDPIAYEFEPFLRKSKLLQPMVYSLWIADYQSLYAS